MIRALDHIVILVDDLDTATADYRSLGFTVVPGGEHADGASHNVLVALADGTYLELIAFKRAAPEHYWWRHTEFGQGLIDFALLPENTAADVAAARERGLEINGPNPGGRLRPDGQRLEWQTARAEDAGVPFLCGDVTPRDLRVPSGEAHRHANGITGIADVVVAVRDLSASAAHYQALLGTPPRANDTGEQMARFALGTSTVTLRAPSGPDADALRKQLNQRGAGIFAVTFVAETPTTLDSNLTHGARLAVSGQAS